MVAKKENEEIYSKSVRSGRRTYFFDVRSTRAEDYYLTITESKRDFNEDGTPFYKKHKIYLYKEDFEEFPIPESIYLTTLNYDTGAKAAAGEKNVITEALKIRDIKVFENIKGDSETLGGFLLEQIGFFPKKNFKLKLKGIEFKVIEVNRKRIKNVLVKIKQ